MKLIRRLITSGTVLLAMVMKAPIWYLPAKASSLTGGDGWHRSYLMDVAFRNFDKWWLVGMSLRQTKDWFYYSLTTTGGADITNQFLSFGFTAGVISMILFFILLYLAFSNLGKALAVVRSGYNQPNESEFLLWGLGTVIVVHLFNWLGITYFDQTYVIWFMQLAAISNFSEQFVYASVIPAVPASTEIDPHVYLGAGNKAAGGLRFGG